jgi:hypothetical protein
MSHSELAIAGFYNHEQENERRAPDWGGDDVFAVAAPRRRRFERSQYPARLRDTTEHPPPAPAPVTTNHGRYMEPVPVGRRTVTITGRPEGLSVPRRPSRTLDERIAHRPERIASWTCAMGFLLILLAVITAH